MDNDENFITGIFNYCDRWCERCAYTTRCRVFAMEQDDPPADEERDINNEAFWRKLAGIFAQTQAMLREKAEELGIDLDAVETFAVNQQIRECREAVKSEELIKLAQSYAREVGQVLDGKEGFAESVDDEIRSDLIDIVRWYQLFIAVKLYRGSDAIPGEDEDVGEDDEELSEAIRHEKDGSIKIALIAIDRSIAAWSALSTAENEDEVRPLISLLENIRDIAEEKFPNARDFLRPGFDEIETVM